MLKKMLLKYRLWAMWLPGVAVLIWYWLTDPNGGAETLSRIQWLVWMWVLVGAVYLVRRAFHPEARSAQAYQKAMEHPIGAGLVFLGLALLTGLLFLAFAGRATAADMPPGALKYLPVLVAEQQAHWVDAPMHSALAAQVEQETCTSLKSKRCWNPTTELKTDREYGFGLGQITITGRFDNFTEARKLDVSLRDWQWRDRYDPARQLRTMVLMDRGNYRRLTFVENPDERLAMAFSAYNGGMGGVLSDRRLCASIAGCDAGRWFGHVEKYSLKAKKASKGYGQSFFEINRGYVRNVMFVRRDKYAIALCEV